MNVTEKMVEVANNAGPCSCHPKDEMGTRLRAVLDHLKAEGLPVEPFDPATWDGETEPPVGYRVVDRDADVWCHGDAGWGIKDGNSFLGDNAWAYLRQFGPFALVPGGPAPLKER